MYWQYLKYVIRHKWHVLIECFWIKQYLHAIMHDVSKFFPSEFVPYAKHFYGHHDRDVHTKDQEFEVAWLLHQHRNKHHWDYWVKSDGKPVPMPAKYISQMIADWRAMGRVFGSNAEQYYRDNKDKMVLHKETTTIIESILVRR